MSEYGPACHDCGWAGEDWPCGYCAHGGCHDCPVDCVCRYVTANAREETDRG